MMAHELARFGVNVRLIDERREKEPGSKAIGVQARTLEIFSALGLYEELIKESHQVTGGTIFSDENAPIHVAFPELFGFPTPVIIDQRHTEAVLENAVVKLGVVVERGARLVDFFLHEDSIEATIEHGPGATEQVYFSDVIGADGAHSTVRKQLGFAFSGKRYREGFIVADAEVTGLDDHESFQVSFKKSGVLGFIPMKGLNHYRILAVMRDISSDQNISFEMLQNIVQKVWPKPLVINKPTWTSYFHVSCRSAAHYQKGRVFLVGDAAHIHSPAGAQGMNTGLQDAFNLGFKLALVKKGLAPSSILETYEMERRPVGEFLLKYTDRLFRSMVQGSFWVRLFRRYFLPYFSQSKRLRTRAIRIISQTAIRYEKGVLCSARHHLKTSCFRVGVRTTVRSKLDLKFLVLLVNVKSVEQIAQIKAELAGYEGSVMVDIKKISEELTNDLLVIIRPDGHVFCVAPISAYKESLLSLKKFLVAA